MPMIISQLFQDSKSTRKFFVNCLNKGQCVVLPTETVYGLAANALDDKAVAKIYAIKGRPLFNPLIIHGPSVEFLEKYAQFHETAYELARIFWPGPLTLILNKKRSQDFSLASAGLETIGVRIPAHEIFLSIVRSLDFPLAAPSANPSNFLSATNAEDVKKSFDKLVTSYNADLPILNGGASLVGIESTIIDATNPAQLRILRPGFITEESLKSHGIQIFTQPSSQKIIAPGQLDRHYAPDFPIFLNVAKPKPNQAWLCLGPQDFQHDNIVMNLSETGDLVEAASHLFAHLHCLNKIYLSTQAFSSLAVQNIPSIGLGISIIDRLFRGSQKA